MHLSEHFTLAEFCRGTEPPADTIPLAQEFCQKILEPLRQHLGCLVVITSGYRDPDHNAAIGGAADSYHVWTPIRCAADLKVPGRSLRETFDWLRLESGLPFDKVILERSKANPDDENLGCIHIQYRRFMPRRLAFSGFTHGAGGYLSLEVRNG